MFYCNFEHSGKSLFRVNYNYKNGKDIYTKLFLAKNKEQVLEFIGGFDSIEVIIQTIEEDCSFGIISSINEDLIL